MQVPASTHRNGAGEDRWRSAGRVSLTLLAISLALLMAAVLFYPGGSWADADSVGFRPFVNYWCDLMRDEAVNGAPNAASAVLAKGAFGALSVSSWAFWRVVAASLRTPTLARWAVVAGTLSSVCLALVAVFPYDTLRLSHVITTLCAGASGFVASVLIMAGIRLSETTSRWGSVWGGAFMAAALVNIIVYVDIVLGSERGKILLPMVQHSGTLFMAIWMVYTVRDAGRRGRTAPDREPR